jgi:nucleoside-diphosphate-sugar epimerase
MKKILITGSTGYLGSVLCSYLDKNKYDVYGCDTGFFEQEFLYTPPIITKISLDARTIEDIDLKGIDVVVHLAGISNDPVGKLDASAVYDPTRLYSLRIAKICKRKGIKFIFASSCSVYGLGHDELLTESSATHPQTFYSLNKIQIEQDLQEISDSSFSPISLRFATIFGPSPRIRFDVVINMLVGMAVSRRSIVLNSNGLSWRPNLYILDACEAIRCAVEHEYHDGELLIMNVGSEENNLQILDIAKVIQKTAPNIELKFLSDDPGLDQEGLIKDRKIREGADNRTYKVSFSKIRMLMPNFQCLWSVERGVKSMIEFLQEIPLTEDHFNSRGYYRLQHLEDLHAKGYLSDELFWLKSRG